MTELKKSDCRTSDQRFALGRYDDQCWQSVTRDANAYFHAGEFGQAGHLYMLAFLEAEDIFISAKMGVDYRELEPVPILVTSAVNLVQSRVKLDSDVNFWDPLSRAVSHLRDALNDVMAPHGLACQSAQHLGYAVCQLAVMMQQVGVREHIIEAEVQKAKETFFQFVKRLNNQH